MQLRNLLSNEPVQAVAPGATVIDAARLMLLQDVGLLPVVENGRLIGVVTDRDIVVRCVAEGKQAELLAVREMMSVEVILGFDDQDVEEGRQLLTDNGLRRLLVADRQQNLLGVVTRASLDGKEEPKKKPVKVTLYKEKTDSHGGHHKVSLRTVYVTGKQSHDEAKEAATKILEDEHKLPLTDMGTGIDAEDCPDTAR